MICDVLHWQTSSCQGWETAPVENLAANSLSDTSISTPFTEEKGSISRTSLAYTALACGGVVTTAYIFYSR